MGPYTKTQTSSAIDDGWEIADESGYVIAHLDTETMADGLLANLLGMVRKEGDDWPPRFDAGVPHGDREDEKDEDVVKTFTFAGGDISDDKSVSVASTVKAKDLEEAKALLAKVIECEEESGGVTGVIGIHIGEIVRLHVRIPPGAVQDDENWEEDD